MYKYIKKIYSSDLMKVPETFIRRFPEIFQINSFGSSPAVLFAYSAITVIIMNREWSNLATLAEQKTSGHLIKGPGAAVKCGPRY